MAREPVSASAESSSITYYYLYYVLLVDALAVFLGNALPTFGGRWAEQWFLVSFSVLGLIFKMIYTDSLFVMFTEPNHGRITTIDQLIQSNIKIFATKNWVILKDDSQFKMKTNDTYVVPKRVDAVDAFTNFSENFAFVTTRGHAVRWTQSMDLLQGQPGELYILDEKIGRSLDQFILNEYSPMIDDINILIQRSVEHGFKKFYDGLEVFFRNLDAAKDQSEERRFGSQAITMENIWIYVYIFGGANCFNFLVFIAEIVIFYRKKILRAMNKIYSEC